METGKTYGYMRVSTKEQNEDRQLLAMMEFGINEKNLYLDKQSGKDFNRPAYRRMLKRFRPGDTLVVKSIDRLGRNYDEILEQWRFLTKERGVAIVVLDMPVLDTRNKDRDLTGTFIADLVLQILSYVAQTERENIRQRQSEGIAAAKARGVHCGRPPKNRPEAFEAIYREWCSGRMSARTAGKLLGVCHKTFLVWTNAASEAKRCV